LPGFEHAAEQHVPGVAPYFGCSGAGGSTDAAHTKDQWSDTQHWGNVAYTESHDCLLGYVQVLCSVHVCRAATTTNGGIKTLAFRSWI